MNATEEFCLSRAIQMFALFLLLLLLLFTLLRTVQRRNSAHTQLIVLCKSISWSRNLYNVFTFMPAKFSLHD